MLIGALGASAFFLTAHTPYPRWYRYRASHTVIATDREDARSFPLGGRLAQHLATRVPEMKPTAARSKNPEKLLSSLRSHQLDLALLRAEDAYKGLHGKPPYAALATPLRVLAALTPEYLYVFVQDGSAIHTIADLRGKRVGLVNDGGRAGRKAQRVVAVFRINPATEIEWKSLHAADATSALSDGRVEAVCVELPPPGADPLSRRLMADPRLRLLPSGTAVPVLTKQHGPIYFQANIDDGDTPVAEASDVMGELRLLVTRDDYPAERARAVAEALADWEERAPSNVSVPIPLHQALVSTGPAHG